MQFLRWAALAALSLPASRSQSYNGLANTPLMGWDHYNAFGCNISETVVLNIAQAMVNTGLRDAGYQYVIIDDCWNDGRFDNGTLRPDAAKFPHGMQYVGDQIHAMGLKFGIFSTGGILTCTRKTGSLGKEAIDAATFASWGADYVKYDNCFNAGQAGTPKLSFDRFNAMSQALNQTGRHMVFAVDNWGEDQSYDWGALIANSWRINGPITDTYSRPDVRCPCTGDEPGFVCAVPGYYCSITNVMNKAARLTPHTGVGGTNDLDALEVGNGGQTDDEYVTQMSIWALAASPLIMSSDLTKATPATLSILLNPAVLAVNQDPSVSGGQRHWRQQVPDVDEYGYGEISLWSRMMNNSDVVVALVNGGNSSRTMTAALAEIFADIGGASSPQAQMNYDVYDLWGYRMSNSSSNASTSSMGMSTSSSGMSSTGMSMGMGTNGSMSTFNATAMSYADGLRQMVPALYGKKVGSVMGLGNVTATVARHGTALLRLRGQGMAS